MKVIKNKGRRKNYSLNISRAGQLKEEELQFFWRKVLLGSWRSEEKLPGIWWLSYSWKSWPLQRVLCNATMLHSLKHFYCTGNWFLFVTLLVPALPQPFWACFCSFYQKGCKPRALQRVWKANCRQGFLKRQLTFGETSLSILTFELTFELCKTWRFFSRGYKVILN